MSTDSQYCPTAPPAGFPLTFSRLFAMPTADSVKAARVGLEISLTIDVLKSTMTKTIIDPSFNTSGKPLWALSARFATILALIFLLAQEESGFAQDFYKDKTLRFIVG